MKKELIIKFLTILLIVIVEERLSQSCNIIPIIKERLKCACSSKNYSNQEYGSNTQITAPYTITGWIRAENPLTAGVVIYALYTTAGDRVFSLHLIEIGTDLKIELYGKNTNRLFLNNFPYKAYQWIFTAVTIYTQSFDLFIMRPYDQNDLVSLSQTVNSPNFGQITSGYKLKTCIHKYEDFTSFCGNIAFISLLTIPFKDLSADGKLSLMYSGGDPKILLKYQFTSYKMNDQENDLSNQGYNIYRPQYELLQNNANFFDLKKDRPKVPVQINPRYRTDGDSFPYPGFTVSNNLYSF